MRRIVVFGGAGFLGSRIVSEFAARGDSVVVVDGLLPGTGGSRSRLEHLGGAVDFRPVAIEDIAAVDEVVRGAAMVVDCMAWTRHVSAYDDPLYDLKLNLESHLRLLHAARELPGLRLVYLGSRGEYGRAVGRITEETPLMPVDVQSVHKAAADHHFRILAERYRLNVVALRLPNCFGPGQPVAGEDIGLIGDWIRSARADMPIRLYGCGRKRWLLYADDLARLVVTLSDVTFQGFTAYNVAGREADLEQLARQIVELAGRGSVVVEEMPREIQLMDIGDAVFDDSRLRQMVGEIPLTDLKGALQATIDYFEEPFQ